MTVLLNRALLNQALPIPAEALMHDWWLALVASRFGQIASFQARRFATASMAPMLWGLRVWAQVLMHRARKLFAEPSAGGDTRAALRQADCFEQRYGQKLSAVPALLQLPRGVVGWRC